MIEPVNNRGYYEYSKINTNIESQLENGEKFSLDYEKKQEQEEKSEAIEQQGVTVELSTRQHQHAYWEQSAQTKTEEKSETNQRSGIFTIFFQIRDFVLHLWERIKTAAFDFWNSDSPQIDEADDTQPKDLELGEIKQYLKSIEANSYAKNSDLLTYYDRSGKIVQLSGADKERILKGEQDRYGKV